jgi:hypothetical protein
MKLHFGALFALGLLSVPLRSQAEDSSLGKPTNLQLAANPVFGTNVDRMIWDSSFGKPTTIVAFDGPPPRSIGPGLRFDTKRWFYVYTDQAASPNHYAPSGWMGDYSDIRVDPASKEDPADGKTCFKISYSARRSQGFGWAGIYWQQPANNWGNLNGGYNLTGMRRVTFWARGARGGEKVAEFKVGGIRGQKPDTGLATVGPVVLTPEWKQYEINLSGVDLGKLSGGFAWSASAFDNPGGITFYIDEIRFER